MWGCPRIRAVGHERQRQCTFTDGDVGAAFVTDDVDRHLIVVASDDEDVSAAALVRLILYPVNDPPTAESFSATQLVDHDTIVELRCTDLEDSLLNYWVLTLPAAGTLYQYLALQDNHIVHHRADYHQRKAGPCPRRQPPPQPPAGERP